MLAWPLYLPGSLFCAAFAMKAAYIPLPRVRHLPYRLLEVSTHLSYRLSLALPLNALPAAAPALGTGRPRKSVESSSMK